MIEKIILKKFQSHKNTELEFVPGLNAIIGPSDSGKSAILRALRWVVTNRPSGEAFRMHGADGETSATLILSDRPDTPVCRYRNDKGNGYKIGESTFQAIGTNVPEEIDHILNMNEINIQQQLDRPFLLDNSPGEVAQHFNKVAHLDIIDKAIQTVQSQCRGINTEINTHKNNISIDEKNLEKYSHLPQFEAELSFLEEIQGQVKNRTEQIEELNRVRTSYQELTSKIEGYKKITQFGPEVEMLLKKIEGAKQQQAETKALRKDVSDIKNCSATIISVEQNLKRKTEEFKTLFPNICPLCGQEVKK